MLRNKGNAPRLFAYLILVVLLAAGLAACGRSAATPTPVPPTATAVPATATAAPPTATTVPPTATTVPATATAAPATATTAPATATTVPATATVAAATETPAAAETPTGEASPPAGTDTAAAPEITHAVAGREQCLTCHAVGTGMVPAPANHETYTVDVCLFCHVPADGEATVPPLPEEASADFCLTCHGPFEALAALTEALVVDENGIEGNPHVYIPHQSERLPGCDNCHGVHPLPVTSVEEIPEADIEYCYNACHHEENFTPCDECHEE